MLSIDDIMVEPPEPDVTVEPMSWFASPGSFEVEIGCGKGGFLLSRARAHPEVRLLGIEWANKYYRTCADRMARWQVTNVRVMRTDAKFLFLHHLPPSCVSVVHLYHPDPWPKKRHHKRRLVQPDFVAAVVRVLERGGRWLIQSDHLEYFGMMKELVSGREELRPVPWEEVEDRAGPDWVGTNFEIKYRRAGSAIYRTAFERV